MTKQYRDYVKVERIIKSCTTWEHCITCINLITQYKKTYGYTNDVIILRRFLSAHRRHLQELNDDLDNG